MYQTAEIRWFSKDPENLKGVFDAFPGQSLNEGPRTDYYFLTGVPHLNIKIREDVAELKWMVKSRTPLKLQSGLSGAIEFWTKASFTKDDPILAYSENISTSAFQWLKISKRRVQKSYILDRNGKPISTALDASDHGCHVEMTALKAGSRDMYTFNLEASGLAENSTAMIHRLLEEFLSPAGVEALNACRCMSYAAWITGLQGGEVER